MLQAAANGYLDVVKWLYSEFSVVSSVDLFSPPWRCKKFRLAIDAAAANGDLDLIQFLHDISPAYEEEIARSRYIRQQRA